MNAADLEVYLHQQIPLTQAMGVHVVGASVDRVELSAPLAPNINHRETIFGGSASAVAILAAWALIYVRLQAESMPHRIVIQRNVMHYDRPMADTFTAVANAPPPEAWDRFIDILKRRNRSRIAVAATLYCHGEMSGTYEGTYVALGA